MIYMVSPFLISNNGTTVGGGYDGTAVVGLIFRTTDGGTTWTQQISGTNSLLMGISFTDVNNGTAVGYNGTILRTTNGGTTWTQQISGTTTNLLGVSFSDINNGTAVGYNSTILRTTNGGTTWTKQSTGTTDVFNGVSFTDINNGTVVGGKNFRTTDGGKNSDSTGARYLSI